MHSAHHRETLPIPVLDLPAEPNDFIHTRDVAAQSYDIGTEPPQTRFKAVFEDQVEDFDIVAFKAGREIFEFERFADHDMLQSDRMLWNRRPDK
jgi:hypothetical protein